MTIEKITENKKAYLDLLLLADEQENMIDRYLNEGEMFLLKDPDVVGECVVCALGNGVFEIKNIAIDPAVHGKGYGRALLHFVETHYKDRCKLLLVGTGDSPLTVPFYLKCGYREHHRVRNFFPDNYDHPIWEAGVQLMDMVYLAKELK